MPRRSTRNYAAMETDDSQSSSEESSSAESLNEHLSDIESPADSTFAPVELTGNEKDISMTTIEPEHPLLALPDSSGDLLLDSKLLLSAIEIHEVCLNFHRLLRISPFLFEDFCCALRSSHHTQLLAEIHIAFLRLLVRNDEENQVTFCSKDTNYCFNAMMQCLDGMTYSEVLRRYLESYFRLDCSHIIRILEENYPFVEAEKRVTVLKWLCDSLLNVNAFKELMSNEGAIEHDDGCRECGKGGELLMCDGCEASYHLDCSGFDEVPEESWFCQICEIHLQYDGIDSNYLTSSMEKIKYRVSPIGFDRHGRVYWFLVRRIVVQDPRTGSVRYYSTLPKLYNLVKELDFIKYEKDLCENLLVFLDEIASQMKITMDLTKKYRTQFIKKSRKSVDHPLSFLDFDNSIIMSDILKEYTIMEDRLLAKIRGLLHIEGGISIDTFWSGGLNEQQLVENDGFLALDSQSDEMNSGFKLSYTDGHFKDYRNEFSMRELAKPYSLRVKEREQRRRLGARFSFGEEERFVWSSASKKHGYYGSKENITEVLQMSIGDLIGAIPNELMHRLWPKERDKFSEGLNNSITVTQFSNLLLQLELAIREPVFLDNWRNSAGLTKFMRLTVGDQDKQLKLDELQKAEERKLQFAVPNEKSNIVFVKTHIVNTSIHALWRAPGEQYRHNGKNNLGGWIWISSTWTRKFEKPLGPIPLDINYLNQKDEMTPIVKKAISLDNIAKKLSMWRDMFEQSQGSLSTKPKCYAPLCKYAPRGFNATLKCYNPDCPRKVCEVDTTQVVQAYKQGFNTNSKRFNKSILYGKELPFPFPAVHKFESKKSKKKSLFILPQAILKRLARQGGLGKEQYLPGFLTSKTTIKKNRLIWPYPCYWPSFGNCWRYLTSNSVSFQSLALSLQLLHASIQWEEVRSDEGLASKVLINFTGYDERRHIIAHRELPPDGRREKYKMLIDVIKLEDEEVEETNSQSKSPYLMRPRKRPSTGLSQRETVETEERWMDGTDLKPNEIRTYWNRIKRKKH